MREYCEFNDAMNEHTRALAGSYFGKKILLATPLIGWYLNKGLKITKIYQGIEFKPKPCFKQLEDEVTHHRSAANKDPDLELKEELFMLLGNSYYGCAIANLEKHTDVTYCTQAEASRAINTWKFRRADKIGDRVYEVQSAKSKVIFRLPELVGYFVYQYAKLRMLQFYYDCLKKHLKDWTWQMIQVDTDSLCFACGEDSLDKCVCPKDEVAWEKAKEEYLVLDSSQKRVPGLFKEE